nr:hypothetical protein [Tanacetum cinerariifolium]
DTNQRNSSSDYGKYGNQQRYSYEKRVNPQKSNWGNVSSKGKSNHDGSSYDKKNVGLSPGMSKGKSIDGSSRGKQDLWQLSKDSSFKPKVLVRGSSLKTNSRVDCNDSIPTMNSFLVLVNDFIDGDDSDTKKDKSCVEEFDSIWPDLKSEVDILMEAGIYPSKSVRLDWTVNQMDYFYKNCHKYHFDPSYKDDDVESEYDGIAVSMKPEFELDAATNMENGAAHASNVSKDDKYSICGLLETHVKKKKLTSICSRVLGHWEWVSNNSFCSGGTRIIVGWDPNCVNVMIMEQSAQAIHCFVELINGDLSFYCSFVYAHIHTVDRRSLWKSLRKYKQSLRNSPWCPGKVGGLLKKLDRIKGNVDFITSFPTSYAWFLAFMTSDHTPVVFVIPEVAKAKPKPFKFHNYLTGKDGFIPAVKKVWDSEIEGFSMFSLVSKLRMLNFDQGNLFDNVERLKKELATIQSTMVSNPFSSDLTEAKISCRKAYKEALKDEELFLRQKSKIKWLSEGDCNSKYFHNVVKGRINRGRISVVEDMNGVPHFGVSVGEQFVNHFQSVLGKCSKVFPINNPESLFTNKLSEGDAAYMIRDISDDE